MLSIPKRTLEKANHIKFRCRLDSQDGKDAHRQFSGSYYPRWRALYLDEIRMIGNKLHTFPVFDFEVLYKTDGDYFYTADFVEGGVLHFGPLQKGRDQVPRKFIITFADQTKCSVSTEGMTAFLIDKKISDKVVAKVLEVRDAFIQRAGCVELGLKDAGRRFRIIDDSGNRKIIKEEFTKALRDVGLQFDSATTAAVFGAFDQDDDGSISFEEFISIMRGPMTERRKQIVQLAFCKVDHDGDGIITLHDLQVKFDAKRHPAVVSGELSEQQVLQGFLACWDTRDKNGQVTFAEFCDYYNGVSASVDSDEEFEVIVNNAWRL